MAAGRAGSLARVAAAYLAALAACLLLAPLLAAHPPLWQALALDLAATLVVFAFSVYWDNSSVYDPYWSVAPPLLLLFWLTRGDAPAWPPTPRQGLILALVLAWSLRLTFNWIRRWGGLGDEDFRYHDFRAAAGRRYWAVSLLGFHLFPTLAVFAGCAAVRPALARGDGGLTLWDLLAAAVTVAAILLEAAADQQLRRYLLRVPRPAFLGQGLWRHVRHPNYTGEVGFWIGLALFSARPGQLVWWTLIGPAAMVALFVGISVPMMSRRLLRKDGYAAYLRSTPALLPRPWRRPRG